MRDLIFYDDSYFSKNKTGNNMFIINNRTYPAISQQQLLDALL